MIKPPQNRVAWIDIAKGISIALVVLWHAVWFAFKDDFPVESFYRFNQLLGPIRMPLFFTVAGVFAGKSIAASWESLVTKKLALYAWLILVWSAVSIVFDDVISEYSGLSFLGFGHLLVRGFFIPNTVLWFLWALAVFFVLSKLFRPHLRWGVGLGLCAALAGLYLQSLPQDAWNPVGRNLAYRGSFLYFIFFFGGAMFPDVIKSLGNSRIYWLPVIMALAVGAVILSLAVDVVLVRNVFQFIASAFSVVALLIASRFIGNVHLVSSALEYLGRNTLPVYVAHMPFILMIFPIVRALGVHESGVLSIAAVLVVTLVVILATLALRDVLTWVGLGSAYRLPKWAQLQRRPIRAEEPSRPAADRA